MKIWLKENVNIMSMSFAFALALMLVAGIFARDYLLVAGLLGIALFFASVLKYFSS